MQTGTETWKEENGQWVISFRDAMCNTDRKDGEKLSQIAESGWDGPHLGWKVLLTGVRLGLQKLSSSNTSNRVNKSSRFRRNPPQVRGIDSAAHTRQSIAFFSKSETGISNCNNYKNIYDQSKNVDFSQSARGSLSALVE
ncbi:hypothetical protein XENOCAPTIV_017968 [Xenoophorus captivus]|uniref:Uncharacterized protein n=1 Tax=Xenoophorus captivus TaxID=1517983 RepID=A0ABV0RMI6_9TELE